MCIKLCIPTITNLTWKTYMCHTCINIRYIRVHVLECFSSKLRVKVCVMAMTEFLPSHCIGGIRVNGCNWSKVNCAISVHKQMKWSHFFPEKSMSYNHLSFSNAQAYDINLLLPSLVNHSTCRQNIYQTFQHSQPHTSHSSPRSKYL